MEAKDLFVFVGAGASMSGPTFLPSFNALRDEILNQLDLRTYIGGALEAVEQYVEVANGVAPELFLALLKSSGVEIEDWLQAVLTADVASAAHAALAQLALAGAAAWTVNFDKLWESGSPSPSKSSSVAAAHSNLPVCC